MGWFGSRGGRRVGWLVLLAACGTRDADEESWGESAALNGPPVLVFAVDGFEWDVALPLLRAGEMPHLAGLMERGVFGTLRTLHNSRSPVLWTTIATGHEPDVHGIDNFTYEHPETGEKVLYTSYDRKVRAFWNLLTDHEIPSVTLGWWLTYPVEEVHGMMVSQTNVMKRGTKKGTIHAKATNQVWPPEAEDAVLACLLESDRELRDHMDDVLGPFGDDFGKGEAARLMACRWAFRADRTYHAVLQSVLDRELEARVTSIYVGGTDVVGHRFWAAHRPGDFDLPADCDEAQRFGHVIPAYYRYTDFVLGEVLDRFPPETTVFVVSDHGMAARPRERLPDGENFVHAQTGGHTHDRLDGIFVAAGHGIRNTGLERPLAALEREHVAVLGRVQDFCPTLLALVDVPFGEDMAGRPLETVLDPNFVAEHPLRSVPTYEAEPWRAERGQALIHDDEERMEQLRALGYLEAGE